MLLVSLSLRLSKDDVYRLALAMKVQHTGHAQCQTLFFDHHMSVVVVAETPPTPF